jgi:hypothetical protein
MSWQLGLEQRNAALQIRLAFDHSKGLHWPQTWAGRDEYVVSLSPDSSEASHFLSH